MKTLIPTLSIAGLALVLTAAVLPATSPGTDPAAPLPPDTPAERRPVDLVVCLDTSGSMTELIDSARAKLWDVVNELAKAKPTPVLRVGLLTYGSPNLSTAEQGWVVRQIDLTTDLDAVYAKMMAMTTNGGDEFVGWVLNDAVNTMSWSDDPNALRMIFVAGNESADQASHRYDFRNVTRQALGKDIVINAIYAGDERRGAAEHWNEVAEHGHGHYAAINMSKGTIQIATPQDEILRQLNEELNATYVAYGRRGREGQANQAAQDRNAGLLGEQSSASRSVAKASALYDNSAWDLVDAAAQPEFEMADVDKEELPEKMRSMTNDEREAYIDGMRSARAAIQKKIQEVSVARQKYLDTERRKRDGDGAALDDAMKKSIRDQAARKDFKFDDGKAAQ